MKRSAVADDRSLRLAWPEKVPPGESLEECARACGVARSRSVSWGRRPRAAAGPLRFLRCVLHAQHDRNAGARAGRGTGGGRGLVIAAEAPQNRDVLAGAGWIVDPAPARSRQRWRRAGGPEEAASALARQSAERFSLDRQLDRMLAIYRELLGPGRLLDSEHTFA